MLSGWVVGTTTLNFFVVVVGEEGGREPVCLNGSVTLGS